MVRTRFAPSPTGRMHIGNIRNAAFSWLYARHFGGQFILRVEDTDQARLAEGAVDEILEGLGWLGLDVDEGPYFQSQRLEIYRAHSEQLLAEGKAYRCWCTSDRLTEMREQQKQAGKPTGYDRRCRDGSGGHTSDEPHVIRFAMPTDGTTTFHDEVRDDISFDNALIDDFVMIKADGFPTYQFANVVDDHLMQVTHVIRSDEWVSSTPKHVQLYKALGWEPPIFAHPALILGPDRSKLSKRHGAVAFADYIQHGYLPDALLNFMALLGWSPGDDREVMTREELVEAFDLPGLVNHPAIFDVQKLDWINRQHIRLLPDATIAELAAPALEQSGISIAQDKEYLVRVCALMKERLSVVSDLAQYADYFFRDQFAYEEKGIKWLCEPGVAELLRELADALSSTDWNEAQIEAVVRDTGARLGREGGKIIHPVRMACTGRTVGPSLFEALAVLGRDRTVRRLKKAAEVA